VVLLLSRRPRRTAKLGAAGVTVTDRFCAGGYQTRTNGAHIFAIGDIVGQLCWP
jgi:pyruvate/2-oxoglutarate dehydrogenase complex dihydrolipoamide dehydrogenase (E3) component